MEKLLIGGKLIAARKDKMMSRGELCRITGLTKPTTQALERGATNYTVDPLMTYADAVGLQVEITKKQED